MQPGYEKSSGRSLVFYSIRLFLKNVGVLVELLVRWLVTDFQAQSSTPPRLSLGQQLGVIDPIPPILLLLHYINDYIIQNNNLPSTTVK